MAALRKSKSRIHSDLELTETFLEQLIEDDLEEDLVRIGIVWAGILGLDKPITAANVAGLLSAYDIVLATALVDSENHWARAAAFAAIANRSEPKEDDEKIAENKGRTSNSESEFSIGFQPSNKNNQP